MLEILHHEARIPFTVIKQIDELRAIILSSYKDNLRIILPHTSLTEILRWDLYTLCCMLANENYTNTLLNILKLPVSDVVSMLQINKDKMTNAEITDKLEVKTYQFLDESQTVLNHTKLDKLMTRLSFHTLAVLNQQYASYASSHRAARAAF